MITVKKPAERARTKIGLVGLIASLTLSGCAVGVPATITSSQPPAGSIATLTLLSESDETKLRQEFAGKIRRALTQRGVGIADDSMFVGDFSIDVRPIALGVDPVTQPDSPSKPEGEEFRSRWYHECRPNRITGSIVIYSRQSGTALTKSEGEFIACPDDMSQLDDLVRLLLDEALGD